MALLAKNSGQTTHRPDIQRRVLGPEHPDTLENDPDLEALHRDPRFSALVAHAKERAAAPQKPD